MSFAVETDTPIDTSSLLDSTAAITVVIPAFNEEGGVAASIGRLRRVLEQTNLPFDIIVVDDGSSDETAAEAESNGARVIRHLENRGYGASLKSGILATESKYVLISDADGTYPADAIPAFLEQIEGADMIVGARAPNSRGIPLIRRPAKWLLTRLSEYLAGRRIPDLNSGLRLFRRDALMPFLPLLPSGFSFTSTITMAMLCNGRRVIYVPIEYHKRVGKSKIQPFDLINFIVLLLRIIVLFNPLKVFLPLGTMLFLAGIGKFVYDLFLWNLSESAVMAFLGAIIVWSVGLLADMIGRLQLISPTRS